MLKISNRPGRTLRFCSDVKTMKTIGSCFAAGLRLAAARRTFASDVKKPKSKITPFDSIKPNERSGVLSTVEKDSHGFPSYIILKETSPILTQAMISIKTKKMRQKNPYILLEGKRLIQDALNAGVKPKQIFFSQKRVLEQLRLPEILRDLPVSNTIFYHTPYKMIELFSNFETSQGIMGIFEKPVIDHRHRKNAFPITVICDNIRDPGNLGAVLRTVTAVGITQIILIKGCTDLWGSKVLSAGCGAHFRMKIIPNVNWSTLDNLKGRVCLADNNNEYNNADSSNPVKDSEINVFRKAAPYKLPIVPYYEVDYCKTTPLILVVGGETHGLSQEGYEFANTHQGIRINIPLLNQIESLNSATAVGILCFEARKQMLNLTRSSEQIDEMELAN